MQQELIEAKHVAREHLGVVLDGGFPEGGPDAKAGEEVHARAAGEHFPASPLKKGMKRRLVQVTVGIALVGVDGQVDFGSGHSDSA